jgi:ABC-type multidrug transport system fused ATPase/permease subunit
VTEAEQTKEAGAPSRPSLREEYARRRDERQQALSALTVRDRAVSLVRVLCIVAAAVGLAVSVWSSIPRAGTGLTIGAVLLFVVLVVVHVRLDEQMHRLGAAVSYFQRGILRIDGEHGKAARTGEKYLSTKHPYADDLDIFGPDSLFSLIDSTETLFGEETLARWLNGEDQDNEGLCARQDAVKDTASRQNLREEFAVTGSLIGEDKPDPRPFVTWVQKTDAEFAGAPLALFARAWPVVNLGMIVLGQLGVVPAWAWIGPVVLGVLVGRSVGARTHEIVNAASTKQSGLRRFATLFSLLSREQFTSSHMLALQKELSQTGATASVEMDRLGRIVGFLDARENEVFRALIAPVLLWDLNCAISLAAWKKRVSSGIGTWFRVLGEVEALFSLAAFLREQDVAFPTLSDETVFVAESLGHPLIPQKRRVQNDVTLAPALVITGSNMSGKSTLLRTLGVNAVLARIGAPVCAKSLTIGPLRIATSLRVRDSLGDGVSRFYAELEKIKNVVAATRKGPTLFLLDEVLAGTNARERIAGAKDIARDLIDHGALGALSTHDLELCKLAPDTAPADENEGARAGVRNVHFEEQVNGEVMTFDYKLRPGIVTTSNALRLMKALGLPVG